MTQEDKKLLLKDLCARLPYEVKISLNSYPKPATLHSITPNHSSYFKIEEIGYDFRTWEEDIKPYLRPMSSMSEEEVIEYVSEWDKRAPYGVYPACDWLNAHHFDYRGLIEKGLAIAVTEENNPYEN